MRTQDESALILSRKLCWSRIELYFKNGLCHFSFNRYGGIKVYGIISPKHLYIFGWLIQTTGLDIINRDFGIEIEILKGIEN